MKIANKKPDVIKSPVRVQEDVYEMYYSKPMNLGTIHKKSGYWYTEDGMRFISSRDALEYLIRIWELRSPRETPPIAAASDKEREKIAQEINKTRPTKKNYPKLGPKKKTTEEYTVEHPLFKKFLEFMQAQKEHR